MKISTQTPDMYLLKQTNSASHEGIMTKEMQSFMETFRFFYVGRIAFAGRKAVVNPSSQSDITGLFLARALKAYQAPIPNTFFLFAFKN